MDYGTFDKLFPKKGINDSKFKAWMAKVDAIVFRKAGVGCDDLPDYCYLDAFEDGSSPNQTACAVIRAAKEDF